MLYKIGIPLVAFVLGMIILYVQGRKIDQNIYKNEER